MPPDTPASQPSPKDRREYFRITVTLPICLEHKTDAAEGTFVKKAVNLSAGGIGVVVNKPFQTSEILSCTLLLADQVPFKCDLEVLRVDPLPYPTNTYRLHGRFVKITSQDRELLIRHVLQFQREHLNKHYSA